ncbi:sigma-54 dependent transcriptional regulator [Silanimonas sp.]|uniref:sigma-54-dependent transcriptional regulator n=1 Tax=Silanimonas sp. TaxID=1929290 RepID=UPI0022C5EA91|nr:sigma-54 dependent transcriptional regulator [Silanimonas sp.]MCZ8064013.1 sigma-54 dependent transcriptional regulator [Silanimonas sp.]
MPTLLVIDDNAGVRTALDVLFDLHGLTVLGAESPEEGLALLDAHRVDLVLQDMNFTADTTSGEEGIALFHEIRRRHPDMPVILLTAWTQVETAVSLMKSGAADYLGKPWDDHKLLASVRNLLELSDTRRALQQLAGADRRRRAGLDGRFDLRGIVYADPAMERVLQIATQVAGADVPVLITGPNGSGKEKVAEVLQANSAVRGGPFVTLNCGALPSELIEAELFGAEAGAYTGATKAREGKFEAADGGTLFLDEIGNLPAAGQMKLLRVLETGRFERLGSNRERQVKVRVISATNADLAAMIRDGRFREDLFYRLNLIELRVPPLAERPLDVIPLAEHFLAGSGKALDDGARRALRTHGWPGNVRELKNTIARAALLSASLTIAASDLGLATSTGGPAARGGDPAMDGDEPDRASIEAALKRHRGVLAQAAAELGLSRQALYRRLERLGINRESAS